MSKTIEFFFDISSPWTCLAFHNIQPIIQRTGATVIWRPFLLGGVHNEVNTGYVESRASDLDSPKWRQLIQVLGDWAEQSNVLMNFPSRYFPLRSVNAMRFCCALEADQAALANFAQHCFDAYFTRQLNLDDPDVLVEVANAAGLDGEALRQASQTQPIKEQLRANTDEAIKRGAFGSPSIFVPFNEGEHLYFGNDQLPLVAWAIQRPRSAA